MLVATYGSYDLTYEYYQYLLENDTDGIVLDYLQGKTVKEIAASLGIGDLAISRRMKKLGFVWRRRGKTSCAIRESDYPRLVEQYEAGLSTTDLSVIYACSPETVAATLRSQGISIRNERKGPKTATPGIVDSRGYLYERISDDDPYVSMRNSSGYCAQHRMVMARSIGRPLLPAPYETVHHIDGNTAHNLIDNLQLRSGNHGSGVVHVCLDCGGSNIRSKELS